MKKANKTVKTKKATKKLVAVKPAQTSKKKTAKKALVKKATKKAVKSAAAPKPVVRRVEDKKKQKMLAVPAVVDNTGMVIMQSIDERDESDDNEGVELVPFMDNGVLTMVPKGE